MGIVLYKTKRQYWEFDFSKTSFEELANDYNQGYEEGKVFEKKHKRRERSKTLVLEAKRIFRQNNKNKIFCQICGFNTEDTYGIDCIEAHHLKAIADMDEGDVTLVADLCMTCPNCHRIIHSKRPCLTIEKVKEIIAKNKTK